MGFLTHNCVFCDQGVFPPSDHSTRHTHTRWGSGDKCSQTAMFSSSAHMTEQKHTELFPPLGKLQLQPAPYGITIATASIGVVGKAPRACFAVPPITSHGFTCTLARCSSVSRACIMSYFRCVTSASTSKRGCVGSQEALM